MTDLTSLIERLEKAEGPDTELDVDVAVELNVIPSREWWSVNYVKAGIIGRYTESADAALKLTARVLPGWCFDEIGEDYEGHPTGLVGFGWTVEISNGVTHTQGQAKTLPVAILLAILLALQSKGEA